MIYQLIDTLIKNNNGVLEVHLNLEITDDEEDDNTFKNVTLKFAINPDYYTNLIPVYLGCNEDGYDIDDTEEQTDMSMFYHIVKLTINDWVKEIMDVNKMVEVNQ
jgi:hypothetical protein